MIPLPFVCSPSPERWHLPGRLLSSTCHSKSPWTARKSSPRSRGILVLTLPGSCFITENQQMLVRLVWFSSRHGLLSEGSAFSAAALSQHPEPSGALLRSQPATQPIWLRPHTLHVGGTDVSRTGPTHDVQTMQSHVSRQASCEGPEWGFFEVCPVSSLSHVLFLRPLKTANPFLAVGLSWWQRAGFSKGPWY